MPKTIAKNYSIKAWKCCMSLAERCSSMSELKCILAIFTIHGIHKTNYAMSKLMDFCALSPHGDMKYASLLFCQIESPNSFIYNSVIRSYSRSSQPGLALQYFSVMSKDANVVPTIHTFHFTLCACANLGCIVLGKQFHGKVYKIGILSADVHIKSALIRMYGACKDMENAQRVFDEIHHPGVVEWNEIMHWYVKWGFGNKALSVFHDMLVLGYEPDAFCINTALTACSQRGSLSQGKWIHEYVRKSNHFGLDLFIQTSLIDMYGKCGCLDSAVQLFDKIPKRSLFCWAAMIKAYALNGNASKAKLCLEDMQIKDGLQPDGVVLLAVLMAYSHAGFVEDGKSLLFDMERSHGISPKHEHYSCVVDLLCRAGQLEEALGLITSMPMKPLAPVWGALLSGCRVYKNIKLAELAARELLLLANGDEREEGGTLLQLSSAYFLANKNKDASKIRRIIGDRGIKKVAGCSMIEVCGMMNVFVSGDVTHKLIDQIRSMLHLFSWDNSIFSSQYNSKTG